ncbi:MAG: hypothetical protein ACJ8DJ_08160 [Gemmatimonadales bacterium]|jgi:hypothetical protein
MRPSRLPCLLLVILLLFHGVAIGTVFGRQAGAPASRTAVAATPGQPGVPLPEHDETTCAVCHAQVTLTTLTLARAIVPDAPMIVLRAPALAEERVPHAPAARPTSSRAPPALRSA